jgi:ubiquinone/menaquinone biosynthesis C-methylase UbiE
MRTFLPADAITQKMQQIGFRRAGWIPLAFGVATFLLGVR